MVMHCMGRLRSASEQLQKETVVGYKTLDSAETVRAFIELWNTRATLATYNQNQKLMPSNL